MATPHTVHRELTKLSLLYRQDMDDQTRAVLAGEWAQVLKDISDEHFLAALQVVKSRSQYFPTPADVRKAFDEQSRSVPRQTSGVWRSGTSPKRGSLWAGCIGAALAKDSPAALAVAEQLQADGVRTEYIDPIIAMHHAKLDGDMEAQAHIARSVATNLPAPLGEYVRRFYERQYFATIGRVNCDEMHDIPMADNGCGDSVQHGVW